MSELLEKLLFDVQNVFDNVDNIFNVRETKNITLYFHFRLLTQNHCLNFTIILGMQKFARLHSKFGQIIGNEQ